MCPGTNLRGRNDQFSFMTSIFQTSTQALRYDQPGGTLLGLAPLMTMACNGVDLTPLGQKLLESANRNPGPASANSFMDLATIMQLKGNPDVAQAMQRQALEYSQLFRLPAKAEPAVRLLAVMFPGLLSGNTPLEFLVEDSDIELTMLYIAPDLPLPESLPEHDVMFVAVGQCEQSRATLELIETLVAIWPRPVLNLPNRISLLSRDVSSALLQSVPGTVMPSAVKVGRTALGQMLGKVQFPIIIRPVDSHAGIGLIKADDLAAVSKYLAETAGPEFFVSRFIDYRSEDGLFRKYRVAFIDGRPHAGHMAISDHWMVHYLSGGMDIRPERRSEEERFFAGFDDDFASRHHIALQSIAERIGLDYLVMDCAETRDGKLLIFEVDSSAVIHAMDPVEVFPYKKPQLRKVAAAFRTMLLKSR